MTMANFTSMKNAERAAKVNGPLMKLLNERWPVPDKKNPNYLNVVERVQAIEQEILDLITKGLL